MTPLLMIVGLIVAAGGATQCCIAAVNRNWGKCFGFGLLALAGIIAVVSV